MVKKAQKAICIFGAVFMLEQVTYLDREIEGVLHGSDIEYIHRMRVASRRLRNGLQLFNDCLPKKKGSEWLKKVQKITSALGNARDLDIQIELLNQLYEDDLDAKYKPGYRRLLLRLKQQRERAQKRVIKAINQLQESDLLSEMRGAFEKKSAGSESAYLWTPSLYQRAFRAVNRALEAFLVHQEHIHDPENIEELHAMRIAGKNLRYTLEIFAPIYQKSIVPHITVMKDLQDQLGAIHDSDVWIAWLPEFIEKEQARIEDYFGNTGPLKRLLPGIQHLADDRQMARNLEYQSFLSTWENLEKEKTWETLVEIIKTPIRIEEALEYIPTPYDSKPPADIELNAHQSASDQSQNSGKPADFEEDSA